MHEGEAVAQICGAGRNGRAEGGGWRGTKRERAFTSYGSHSLGIVTTLDCVADSEQTNGRRRDAF
jgi:hypothetical protein